MAIRIPDLGTGSGAVGDGDNELEIRQDYNHNFSDETNAASRLVGTAAGQVPLAEHVYKAAFSKVGSFYDVGVAFNVDTLSNGDIVLVSKNKIPYLSEVPSDDYLIVEQQSFNNEHLQGRQVATGYRTGMQWQRVREYDGSYPRQWQPVASNPTIFTTTTAEGANTVITVSGELRRSTSSERYKEILAPLELDDTAYEKAMALKPIVYRSTADADNPLHHYYSFSAEELGAYDPAFTLWRTTLPVTGEDGIATEQPLAERQAEGININALLAMSHAIAIKQGKLIKNLQEQMNALKSQSEV